MRFGVCCFGLFVLALTVGAQDALDQKKIAAGLDHWLMPYVAAHDFSGVVLIAQGDRLLVEKAYGMADFARRQANTAASRFRVASLSKTLTASAIELLVQRGKVRLNDTLEQYVPGIANGSKITLNQLLLHESGVGVVDTADRYQECLGSAELLRRLRLARPLFEPGKDDQYSNEGYFLLALVIEKVSGESYETFLLQNIFTPLAMSSSGSACKELPSGPNSTGNVPAAGPRSLAPTETNEAVEIGPGSIYTTAGDLYRWLRAVDTDARFQTTRWEYPYGWGKRNYSGRDLIEQSGILEGFNAHMALYPKEHIYAVVLSNVQSGFLNRIPKDLEAVLFGGQVSTPPDVKPIKIPLDQLEPYKGEYATQSTPYHQSIFLEHGNLAMRWGKFPFPQILIPTNKDEFYSRHEYAMIRFTRDASGKVVTMSWQWPNGPPMAFERLNQEK